MRRDTSRRAVAGVVGLAVLAGVCLVGCRPTVAPCTATWTGPAGGDFQDEMNWSTGRTPSTPDRVCAPEGSSIAVQGVVEVDAINARGVVTVTAGSSLTVNRTATGSSIRRLQLDGLLGGAATITLAELWSSAGATIAGSGQVAVGDTNPSAVDGLTIDGSRTLVVGPNVALSGTVHLCDTARLLIATTTSQTLPLTLTSAGCAVVDRPQVGVATDGAWTVAVDVDASTLDIVISGSLTVASGATLRAAAVHQEAGTSTLAATSATIDLAGTGTYHLRNGLLTGHGTIAGSLTGDAGTGGGAGVVHAGSSSTGRLTISGDVTGDGVTFEHTITAGAPSAVLNQVAVDGTADVTGARLSLSAIDYVPARGARVVPIITPAATGAMATIDAPAIAPLWWQQQNTTTGVTLKVLPGTPGDVDGDGKADLVFLDTMAGRWYLGGAPAPFGPPPATLLYTVAGTLGAPTGDFDGDGTTDFASVTTGPAGGWSTSGAAGTIALPFTSAAGRAFVVPVPGDYDGDGATDPGWYDGATATWYLAGRAPIAFGSVGTGLPAPSAPATTHRDWDYPVPADYDGDGRTDLATWNPRTNLWTMRHSGDGTVHTTTLGDAHQFNLPAPADYAGTGRAVPALFTAGVGWRIEGQPGDAFGTTDTDVLPAVADYDGDGRADLSYVTNFGASATTAWKFKSRSPYPLAAFGGAATNRLPAAASMDLVGQVARFSLIQQDCLRSGLC